MTDEIRKNWPPLERAYTDEFGEIEPEVYAAADKLWPQAEMEARDVLDDPDLKQRLLLRAVADVTRVWRAEPERIDNLPGYLFKAYRRLLWHELKKIELHRQLERNLAAELEASSGSSEIEAKILFEELLGQLDGEMRYVILMRAAGHTFAEIARALKRSPHTLRTKYSKQLARLRKAWGKDKP